MAQQMLRTMYIHEKGRDPEERKYYHFKLAFDPADRIEKGGTLTPDMANTLAHEYAQKMWPNREVVWTVQDHGASIHIHFIVAACDLDGKKMDVRDEEYRAMKDYAQEQARAHGLSDLDWRKATKRKRSREIQEDLPVRESFAETGLQAREATSWKSELRELIDQAAATCRSMDEFEAQLEAAGVKLTRKTEETISYKYGDHRACRGDTLGGDYTAAAIRSALKSNAQELTPESSKEKLGIDALIGGADRKKSAQLIGGRVIAPAERELYRDLGRFAGIKRSEIDGMIEQAAAATWEEKKQAWAAYSEAKEIFWAEYAVRQEMLRKQIDAAYKRRRKVKDAEWAMSPRNRRSGLLEVFFAAIVLARNDSSYWIQHEIEILKLQQERLREEMADFKGDSAEALDTLREKGLSLDAYMATVRSMQQTAERIAEKNGMALTPEERARIEKAVARKKAQRAKQRERG